MTAGRFLARVLAIAVAIFILGYIGHQLLLGRDYVVIEPIMRNKADLMAHMPFAFVNALCFSTAFVWLHSQGRSARSWLGQGIRFGVAIWAVVMVPLYLTNDTIEPWPGVFVAKILAWELVAVTALGILVAALAKNDFADDEEHQASDLAQQGRKA
jgi:hypothetical protein